MKISIITMVFNNVQSIENTIRSVINSKKYSNSEIEYIVIDGKSTDGTLEIIKKYKNDINILISEKDNGIHDAMNKGINAATGDYLFFLAADDQLLKNALIRFENSIKEITEIWCGGIVTKEYGVYKTLYSDENLNLLYEKCSLRHPATFFRSDVFDKYGKYDDSYLIAADREIFLRLYTAGAQFQIEKIPIVLFDLQGISSINNGENQLEEDIKISVKYGMDEEKAKNIHRQEIKNKSNGVKKIILKICQKIHLYSFIYKIFGSRDILSAEELRKMGIV